MSGSLRVLKFILALGGDQDVENLSKQTSFLAQSLVERQEREVSLNCRPVFVHATIIDSLPGPSDWRSWRRGCDRTPCLETGRGYRG